MAPFDRGGLSGFAIYVARSLWGRERRVIVTRRVDAAGRAISRSSATALDGTPTTFADVRRASRQTSWEANKSLVGPAPGGVDCILSRRVTHVCVSISTLG